MNTLKLLIPLLITYGVAADLQDAKKAIDVLKDKGKVTYVNKEKTYYLDTAPMGYITTESTLRYHEFFNGKEALSYEYKESIDDKVRTTAIYDYLGGKVDGTPDIFVVTEMNKAQRRKQFLDDSFDSGIFTTVGKIDSLQSLRYEKALEEIKSKSE